MSKRLTYTVIVLVSIALLSSLTVAFTNRKALAQKAKNDKTNDLIRGCTGESVSQANRERAGFIDIVKTSASVEGSTLILRLESKEPIPTQASNLVSYSFALDLDGDKETGFIGNRSPLGVFPELGIDLWVTYSLYHKEEEDLGFLGPRNIPDMNSTPNLTSYEFKDNRSVLEVTVPLNRIEMKLKYAYMQLNPAWEVKPNKMEWVAYTNWAYQSGRYRVSDFFPEKYHSTNYGDCFANPLVKIVKLEEEDEETGGGTGDGRDSGGDNGGGKKEPPSPPPPPTPPS